MTRLIVVASVLALTGCATTYYNPNITDATALERQRAIDEGYCTRASAGSVPIPQVRAYQPQQQNYQIAGTVNTYTPNAGYSTSNYSANVYSQPNPGAAFASGFASGANMGAAFAAAHAQEKIFHGCMLALGWNKDKDAKPSAPAPTATPTSTTATSDETGNSAIRREMEVFFDMEAARPGGIDYRRDNEKNKQLMDHAVRIIVSTPSGQSKSITQVLMEANNLVLQGK